jgi:hypothetical protein
MKIEVKEQIKIPDGLHKGAIIMVEYRTTPQKYEYTDVIIEFKYGDKAMKLRAGYPTVISESSKLGKLMVRFGHKLVVGQDLDPDSLIGKPCEFITLTEKGKDGNDYARVIPDSVKP